MTIVQLTAFDLATSQPWQIMATTNLWSALPRLSRGNPSARLLMIADTLHIEDIQAGFHQVAVLEDDLPVFAGARQVLVQPLHLVRLHVRALEREESHVLLRGLE